jgi:hypothetical protein
MIPLLVTPLKHRFGAFVQKDLVLAVLLPEQLPILPKVIQSTKLSLGGKRSEK